MAIETSIPTVLAQGGRLYNVRPPALVSRIRLQLGVGLLLACALPQFVRDGSAIRWMFTSTSQYITLIAITGAVILGYFSVRRLTRYPGITGISYILPTFTISYGIALGIILLFRLDYSRFVLITSFVSAQLWFHFIAIVSVRANELIFDVIPMGNAKKLCSISQVRWNILKEPHPGGPLSHGLTADLRADLPEKWEAFIAESAVNGVPVYHYKQLSENLTGKVEIEHLSENNLGSLLPSFLYLRFKQSIDIAVAVLILPILVPLFGVIAWAIKMDSEGPVFFRQERMGYRGQVFRVWKFRTMEHDHSTDVSERRALTTVDGDPRVTKIGQFLRRTRLDELPQIFNILRGEMSWIGPRPEAVTLSKRYETKLHFYRYRHIVRPGITGWAQVNQGHVAEVDEVRAKLHYDFYYIKNFSVWLDILITMRTIAVMLTGFGAR